MRRIGLVLSISLAVSAAAQSNPSAGTAAYTFLRLPVDARSAAMAGAGAAMADDVSALHDNPAGIVDVPVRTLVTSYANHILDVQSGFVGVVHPYGEGQRLGFGVTYLNWGGTPRTDAAGTREGEFGASDLAAGISYARSLSERFSFGVTTTFVYEKIDEWSSTGLSLDLGALYRHPGGNVRVAAVARNLGFQLSGLTEGHKDKMPTELVAGFSAVPKGLPIRLNVDGSKPLDDDFSVRVGAETITLAPLYLRAGYDLAMRDLHTGSTSDAFAGVSGGAGFNWRSYRLDYSITSYAALGTTHRLGVAWRF